MSQTPPREARLHLLDALRGIAAILVVVYHWQQFRDVPGMPPRSPLPIEFPLNVIYQRGLVAVDVFFALSGFVFLWLYAKPICERRISFGRFFALRFSRLYPLHVVTLAFIVIGQLAFRRLAGRTLTYECNGVGRFLLNLSLTHAWFEPTHFTFNGPAWSISVEVLLYLTVFALARTLGARPLAMLALMVVGFVVQKRLNDSVGRGLWAFYAGGLAFLVFDRVKDRGLARPLGVALVGAAATFLATDAAVVLTGGGRAWGLGRSLPLRAVGPPLILGLALLEHGGLPAARRLAILGELSYAVYLLHFPLQLVFASVVLAAGRDPEILMTPGAMALFFAILLPAAWSCHHGFELPAQRALRRALAPRPDVAATPRADGAASEDRR